MMLKVVKLLKLYVENFRGIKNFVLTPDGRSATVQGGNGTGKSTLMAAFLWLLTGKDAQGRENYNVFPLGTDGNRLSGCSPTVTATLSMPDGHTLVLQRSICERWTKRRGSAETEYNGDETRYFIDEVPVSAGEYSSAIFGVFPEKLLPLLLNAVWFSEQTKDYKERRRLLLEQFGSLQPADVFTANPELSDLESMLGTHSVDEFSRICTERRKRYKDSLSALPARIDENRKQLHPVSDAGAVKNERSKLNVEIAKLQYEIEHTTADAVQRHNQQELEKVQQYLEMIPNKRRVLEASGNAGWLEEHNRRVDDATREKQNAMCRVETLAAELRSLNRERDFLAAERDRLRVEWVEVNGTVPDIAQTCPTCGQALPAELVQEAQENFNVSKSERLSDIAAKGAKAAQDVEKMEKKAARLREDLDTCERAAKAAAAAYDMAEASGADVPPAVPAEPADYNETAKMVNATKQSPPQLQGGVSRLVKRAGADTTLKNAIRDGAEWAWVPHGDTCAFCITLASRGWQRASKKALKGDHAEHIHAHCNCEYAVRFDSRTTVAGYDPEKYLTQYNAHGGDINAMRREQYAKNKDKINDQKRAAYAARMDRQAVVKPGNGKAEKSAAYKDVTLEMYAAATPNSHRVQDLQEYAVGGMTYKVDGHNVQLDYSAHEKEIAELLERELGGEIYMVPRVNNPQGVRTPDYLFRGKGYDLKTLESKAGQNTIYQRIKKGKKQAENFVVDVSKAEQITEEIINKQVEKIFSDPETAFVNEVVIVRDGAILKAAKKT